jgi:ribosomal protein L11 methyltransferase
MKFKRIRVQFEADDLTVAEELICDIFFSFHLKGVVCDVPLEEPDEGFGTHTLPRPDICSVTGFLPLLDSSKRVLERIREEVLKLSNLKIKTHILVDVVDEKDWADAWKTYFDVTRITDRIIVKPAWKDHTPRPDEIVIHLDPGMAFGTGTHPTTAMCVKLMENWMESGSRFLDVGTGSGILMVAAAKLGAGHLSGIDTDEVALEVARENLIKNTIDPALVDLACTTLDKTDSAAHDFIAANIIAQVIVDILPDISLRMTGNSFAVLSGIIRERLIDVNRAIETAGLFVIHEEAVDEWVALVVNKSGQKQTSQKQPGQK